MDTFDDLISAFGGPAAFGRAIGISTERAAEMRRRGSVPPDYWHTVIEAAQAQGVSGVTADLLAKMRASRRLATSADAADKQMQIAEAAH